MESEQTGQRRLAHPTPWKRVLKPVSKLKKLKLNLGTIKNLTDSQLKQLASPGSFGTACMSTCDGCY